MAPVLHRDSPKIVAIVNLSEDSFSDGGCYSDPDRAAQRVRRQLDAGAYWVELGAASSHPDAVDVSVEDEIRKIAAVLDRLAPAERKRVGVDTWKPEVQVHCLRRGIAFINDIAGFGQASIHAELARSECALVVMHSVQRGKATRARAQSSRMLAHIEEFLLGRCASLIDRGVDRGRIIVDPGMGFFLSELPEVSVEVLASIGRLRQRVPFPLLVSVSRKSFLGALTGRNVGGRAAATLAAELYAAAAGVDYIRTHDVDALVDGLTVTAALRSVSED